MLDISARPRILISAKENIEYDFACKIRSTHFSWNNIHTIYFSSNKRVCVKDINIYIVPCVNNAYKRKYIYIYTYIYYTYKYIYKDIYVRVCMRVCIVGIRQNGRRTSASFLARRHARARNDANHVHDGDYRLLFILRRNNFERDTRV